MPTIIDLPEPRAASQPRVRPSRGEPRPFTLEQELEPFARWVGEPIWAPPLDSAQTLAESMLQRSRPFASRERRWRAVVQMHRNEFAQVREVDLAKASIRLPKGRLLVSVTEQKHFDRIEEEVPDCVRTRLEEFLMGQGARTGVRVYYLKPLCVEVGDRLVMTTREELTAAIERIKADAFAEYARRAPLRRTKDALRSAARVGLAGPKRVAQAIDKRRRRALDAYHARMEFERRKTALDAMRMHQRRRTNGCTFDEMLSLTNPLEPSAVARQYSAEKKLSTVKRRQIARMAAGSTPWFVTLALAVSEAAAWSSVLTFAPPVLMCDPAFVAELPGTRGVLWKIGHFDEVGGVVHVEL
ncbi:hypothetical protein [Botrimarina sp.]|uniref:hypothetical protein n=1 Tax=Botrimarina sp. TaxID=2795802 RepID=UPI0032EEA3F6